MAEKRKPTITIIAKHSSKKNGLVSNRLELFDCALWPRKFGRFGHQSKYRIRFNGKWFCGDKAFYFSEAIAIFRKSYSKVLKSIR